MARDDIFVKRLRATDDRWEIWFDSVERPQRPDFLFVFRARLHYQLSHFCTITVYSCTIFVSFYTITVYDTVAPIPSIPVPTPSTIAPVSSTDPCCTNFV